MNYGLFPGFPQQALANLSHGCAVFTSAESGQFFLVPDGVYELFVMLVGGGGGGGIGGATLNATGGQGGQVVSRKVAVLPGQQIRVTIGAGGGSATAGGASTFGSLASASGGAAGLTAASGSSYISPAGGDGLGQGGAARVATGVGNAGNGMGAGGGGGYGNGQGGGAGTAGGCWVFW